MESIYDSKKLAKLSTSELENIKKRIENIIDDRLYEEDHDSRMMMYDRFINEWFVKTRQIIKKRKYDTLIGLYKAYYKMNNRWIHKTGIKLEFGDKPPCDSLNCWWENNLDKSDEYNNDIYIMTLYDYVVLCEKCYYAEYWKEIEQKNISFDVYVNKYLEWIQYNNQ